MVIEIARDITSKLLRDTSRDYSPQQLEKATAADLSQELSTPEIDAWLDGLPPRQRAVALFLYASDVQPSEVAAATGLPPDSVGRAVDTTKINLLQFFRDDADSAIQPQQVFPRQDRAQSRRPEAPRWRSAHPDFLPLQPGDHLPRAYDRGRDRAQRRHPLLRTRRRCRLIQPLPIRPPLRRRRFRRIASPVHQRHNCGSLGSARYLFRMVIAGDRYRLAA